MIGIVVGTFFTIVLVVLFVIVVAVAISEDETNRFTDREERVF